MCTATWLTTSDGYELFCNRDERKTRKPAEFPTLQTRSGVRFIAPRDGNAGGSWIGVNEFGLALCLLNLYQRDACELKHVISRGRLLLSLLDCHGMPAVVHRLQATLFKRFKPFVLLALEPDGSVAKCTWDGSNYSGESGAETPVTTSSYDTANVVRARIDEFSRLPEPHAAPTLEAYHMSHDPRSGANSVCMERDDARTVSFSHVIVAKHCIEFQYYPRLAGGEFSAAVTVTCPQRIAS